MCWKMRATESKRLLMVFGLVMLISGAVQAQTWNELLSEAKTLWSQRLPDSARAIGNLALETAIAQNGQIDTSVAMVLHRLGAFNHSGNSDKAEDYYNRALEVWDKAPGARAVEIAKTLGNLGNLYINTSRLEEAEPLLIEALAIKEPQLGFYHASVATSYLNLGKLQLNQGDYTEAERNYRAALKIRDSILEPTDRKLIFTYNHLGVLMYQTGRTKKAIEYIEQSIQLSKLARFTKAAAGYKVNLAVMYVTLDAYGGAETLLLEALEDLQGDSFSTRDARYLGLNNLGWAYLKTGRYHEAETPLREALELCRTLYGENHTKYARTLLNLAEISMRLGNFSEALRLIDSASAIRGAILGLGNSDLVHSNVIRASIHWLKRDYVAALDLFGQNYDLALRDVLEVMTTNAESDALAMSKSPLFAAGRYLSCLLEGGLVDEERIQKAYDIIFQSKGGVSDELFNRARWLHEQDDPIIDSLARLRNRSEQEVMTFTSSEESDSASVQVKVDSLTELVDELGYLLAQRSLSFRNTQGGKDLTLEAVRAAIPDSALLIEYIMMPHYRADKTGHTNNYLVVALSRDTDPVLIDLGDVGPIDTLVNQYRTHMLAMAEQRHPPSQGDRSAYHRIARSLYDVVLKPIEDQIGSHRLVILAPDAGLNLVSFAGLVNESGEYLIEKVALHYISSGRDLVRLSESTQAGAGLVALADPDYDLFGKSAQDHPAKEKFSEFPTDKTARFSMARSGIEDLAHISAEPLPQSRNESRQVIFDWAQNRTETADSLFGSQATEKNFRVTAPGQRVIYLATHGFFLANALLDNHPLLQSGLLLAGANSGVGESIDQQSNDGILTALEVSALDLSGVELAVLSACESGLGKVEQGEGVYGLRRAFQMAGVRTVVSSLWPISDRLTTQMMSDLFRDEAMAATKRLQTAQLEQLRWLRETGLEDHPYSWAGFITIGDWR